MKMPTTEAELDELIAEMNRRAMPPLKGKEKMLKFAATCRRREAEARAAGNTSEADGWKEGAEGWEKSIVDCDAKLANMNAKSVRIPGLKGRRKQTPGA